MTPDQAIGLAVREARLQQGLSQEEIGASQSFVSDVERGKKSVTMARLDGFAKTLGIQPATLMVRAALISQPELTLNGVFDQIRTELSKRT
jgi:transcriptional regulator with XRE-family HTH domain